jgi:cytoplasmic iron level regulating protein YaaA (DUF328/UPF0246 family)
VKPFLFLSPFGFSVHFIAAMLFLLSPAKSLDYETPAGDTPHSQPLFVDQAAVLIKALRKKSWRQVSKLMDLSQNLSELNVTRYASWTPEFTPHNAKQAVLAFDGDVYDGLVAKTLQADDLAWAQDHLCILSGLYGVLRPLDLMQPYRLEMGTTLKVGRPDNLYQYWQKIIAPYLNDRLQAEVSSGAEPVVINLASQEYFKAVSTKLLKARVVHCTFEDFSNGQFKVVSFFAKKARGMMARYAIQHRVESVGTLEKFTEGGYSLAQAVSTPDRLVFRRQLPE